METGAVCLIMVSAGLLQVRTETARFELRPSLLRASSAWPDRRSVPDEFLSGLGREFVSWLFWLMIITVSGLVATCMFGPSWTRGVPRNSTSPVAAV